MNFLSSPRNKLVIALALLAVLGGASAVSGLSFTHAARGLLVLGALAVLGLWVYRGKARARFSLPDRLTVLSRTGLSQRCGLALVEADGEPFLVAFGDGFAVIKPARLPRKSRSTPKQLGGAR